MEGNGPEDVTIFFVLPKHQLLLSLMDREHWDVYGSRRTFPTLSYIIVHVLKLDVQSPIDTKNLKSLNDCLHFSILQINNGTRRKLFHLMICLFFHHSCTSGQYCDSFQFSIAVSILLLIDLFIFASI